VIDLEQSKIQQVCRLINRARINPVDNESFFYSIDPYSNIESHNQVLENNTIDYSWVINSSFSVLNSYCDTYSDITVSLKKYIDRARNQESLARYSNNFDEIISIFSSKASHFHEALQRILFINQWLWQSNHKLNGLGHLDWLLYDLYIRDINSGYMGKDDAHRYVTDFFRILHSYYWFKSTQMLGDTGQIIVLGGLDKDGTYRYNELTYLFIEVSLELKLPDPKVLLRVSAQMPDELLERAVKCIATGIGAPLLSNDDRVIPAMIQFGYDKDDAYNYSTSACWEPFSIGNSCEHNNIIAINFCLPFNELLDCEEFDSLSSTEQIIEEYYIHLDAYINAVLSQLDKRVFETDPLLTLFNPEILKTKKDIVNGGAKYSNMGVTTIGLSSVVNSILNIQHYVFDQNAFTLHDLNELRKANFIDNKTVLEKLKSEYVFYGQDNKLVIDLTNRITRHTSTIMEKHNNNLGGRYKFGLSSPNYISGAKNLAATFDGRKNGEPFSVHISGKNGVSPTELISFASQLDYNSNRINGNVVDFILSPSLINDNFDKIVLLIKGGIKQGFYQMQINVTDSKTLIEAQKHPELYQNLVVRVWGYSAYFKDLPLEYQNNLIKRALEAENRI
jgi:formate C-acetyltransferase